MFRVGMSGEFWNDAGEPCHPVIVDSPLHREPGVEFVRLPERETAEADDLVDVDAFVTMECSVTSDAIRPDPRLAIVVRGGVGYDDMALDAMARAGVAYANAPTALSEPVGLAQFTLMLAVMTRLIERVDGARGGDEAWWRGALMLGSDPRGKTVGLLGFGGINRVFLRMTGPFDMRAIAWNRSDRSAEMAQVGCEQVDLETLFAEADVLAICLPLNDETHHIVSADRLALMKPGAIVLNVGRGGLIDEPALIEALRAGRIAGAGLDVTQQEPVEPDNPLLAMPNVVVTPHGLCLSDRCFGDAIGEALDSVLAVKRGEVPANLVNTDVSGHPVWIEKLQRHGIAHGQTHQRS
ncbi:MAG: NAD(P)-dependent oxidoreductase [Alphaproteobacteria bacterium]|jgi:phosphoglycerate dehydrogenase-like enzyme|nr:hypothetical protein [Rhodospirillaceae bacterium]MBT6205525.1 hypothetical protein [Rhodospirillaceae bacterium]MBT6509815.1 hypothetical protein [Rhodospirillaceae bacterium]MBT7649259.1 hypothetical protein [Rhodospirillaceae bacterium]MDG2481200.1 NAD(P)-dependent oxidoreductase [Alphaproteobacteria bacterium]